VGRVRFVDTRPDDPNDVVPHQDRRELRGYGVFAAWLNHVDAKAINSLDVLVTENGRSVVRHYLIDFGSALGSGGVAPADYWAGFEYLVQPVDVAKQMVSFGFNPPKWRTTPFFEAVPWAACLTPPTSIRTMKPRHRTRRSCMRGRTTILGGAEARGAHDRHDSRGGACRRIRGSGRGGVSRPRALAGAPRCHRPDVAAAVNPISRLTLDDAGVLAFENAAVEADFARIPRGYRAVWLKFDNTTHHAEVFGESSAAGTELQAPESLPRESGAFVKVELHAVGSAHASWEKPANAYFRLDQGGWKLVGFERMAE
jgi:hypothetical protein